MSMLNTQCDELRKMAAAYEKRGSAIGLEYGMGLGLVDAARMMREAAVTIEVLSAKLADLIDVEIVRCRDCEFGVDNGKYCAEGCADSWDWRNVEPDGFCAWGERRSE